MPNMLVHFAVQGGVSRVARPGADFKWVMVGALVPDLPWILQRAMPVTALGLDPYDFRLYGIVQASLFMCLILAGAIALLADRRAHVFAILASNCMLHLVLDAMETKWGNGVNFFAPMSWALENFGLFWPESVLVTILTAIGLVVVVVAFATVTPDPAPLRPDRKRIGGSAFLIAVYILLPAALIGGPESSDTHSVRVLRNTEARVGSTVAFDRVGFVAAPGGMQVRLFTGETLHVLADDVPASGNASVRGAFVGASTVRAEGVHYHRAWLRDGASYVALLMFVLIWGRALWWRPEEAD